MSIAVSIALGQPLDGRILGCYVGRDRGCVRSLGWNKVETSGPLSAARRLCSCVRLRGWNGGEKPLRQGEGEGYEPGG